jgi:hypothetical protein
MKTIVIEVILGVSRRLVLRILMIERKTGEDIITGEENRALVVVRRERK